MKPLNQLYYFIIDVESVGLYGDGFAVAWGVYDAYGKEYEHNCLCTDRTNPTVIYGVKSDRNWVKENVPHIDINVPYANDLWERFWQAWLDAKHRYPDIVMAAECLFPVEANFISRCVRNSEEDRKWKAPYPFVEISSIMMAAGMDSMKEYPRSANELPKHHPMADVRQSARLLANAISQLTFITKY